MHFLLSRFRFASTAVCQPQGHSPHWCDQASRQHHLRGHFSGGCDGPGLLLRQPDHLLGRHRPRDDQDDVPERPEHGGDQRHHHWSLLARRAGLRLADQEDLLERCRHQPHRSEQLWRHAPQDSLLGKTGSTAGHCLGTNGWVRESETVLNDLRVNFLLVDRMFWYGAIWELYIPMCEFWWVLHLR